MTSQNQPTLTGLEQPSAIATTTELAAHRQLKALDDAGLLHEEHSLLVQLVRDLSAVVGRSCADGKAAAAALASKQLLDVLAALPKPAAEGDALGRMAAELQQLS